MKKLAILLTLLSLLLMPVLALAQDETEATAEATAETTTTETVEATTTSSSSSAGLTTGLLHLHSLVRWIVVLITVAAIIKLGMGFMQSAAYDALAKRLVMFFTIGVTLQWALGIILFIVMGAFDVRYRWEHAITMTIAVGISHMTWRFSKLEDSKKAYRNNLIIIIAVLVVVYLGVAVLPQGWRIAPV